MCDFVLHVSISNISSQVLKTSSDAQDAQNV